MNTLLIEENVYNMFITLYENDWNVRFFKEATSNLKLINSTRI